MRFLLFLLFSRLLFSQNPQKYQSATVVFYNVENLFDTLISAEYINGTLPYYHQKYHVSVAVKDTLLLETTPYKETFTRYNLKGKKVVRALSINADFSPNGRKKFSQKRYQEKLKNIAKALEGIGKEFTRTAPILIGLAEIENKQVLKDLIGQKVLLPYAYGFVHFNSFDFRGIDCALLYQKERFAPLYSKPIEVAIYQPNGNRYYTRDILYVNGLLDGEKIHIYINHWPSRRGGETSSAPRRKKVAYVLQKEITALLKREPSAKILIMGDFNDTPQNASIKEELKDLHLLQPFSEFHKKGIGTTAYRDHWSLFDQILYSSNLKKKDFSNYQLLKSGIFNPAFLVNQKGPYKGYPKRSYAGNLYQNGYSDHFPVYGILLRKLSQELPRAR